MSSQSSPPQGRWLQNHIGMNFMAEPQQLQALIGGIAFLEGAPMADISGLDPNCWEVCGCCW
jgi:hypothetical protein